MSWLTVAGLAVAVFAAGWFAKDLARRLNAAEDPDRDQDWED